MKKYSEEVKTFIAQNIKGMTTKDLAELVNIKFGTDFTESKMRSYKKNHGLKSETRCGIPAGRPTDKYPAEVREFIRNNYIGVGHQGMADLLNQEFGTNYTKGQMKAIYSRFKLNSGRTGRFPKGNVPVNKGKKGHSYPGMVATQFKKGNIPRNWWPVGTEMLRADGYIWKKVAEPNKWRQKHVLIWEAANGPRPVKHVVIFGDSNRSNFDPNNLILISQAQLVRMNQKNLIRDNVELTRTGVIIADICNKIGMRRKKTK
ncbi:HNH endonuclease signature motif containing protein [Dehalobacter restrictus]|uniref:HNH endonuclease signature motif containing protein n=1 Tax=Dehalobacter restrictus TaxID=55583 RepID=UPI00338E1689